MFQRQSGHDLVNFDTSERMKLEGVKKLLLEKHCDLLIELPDLLLLFEWEVTQNSVLVDLELHQGCCSNALVAS